MHKSTLFFNSTAFYLKWSKRMHQHFRNFIFSRMCVSILINRITNYKHIMYVLLEKISRYSYETCNFSYKRMGKKGKIAKLFKVKVVAKLFKVSFLSKLKSFCSFPFLRRNGDETEKTFSNKFQFIHFTNLLQKHYCCVESVKILILTDRQTEGCQMDI